MSRVSIELHGQPWKNWILENLERGCDPVHMCRDMVRGPWLEVDAMSALSEGLAILNKPRLVFSSRPSIDLEEDSIRLDNGSVATVLCRARQPSATLLSNVLSVAECLALVELAEQKGLAASSVVDDQTGLPVSHVARTSTSVFFTRAETPLIAAIEARLAGLTRWPLDKAEGLQVLRYAPGQQYKPHFDWFDREKSGSAQHLQRGGQRVATTVLYLQVPDKGGATSFPIAGLSMRAPQGGAIFFQNTTELGDVDESTLHAGDPVLAGVKIIATYWQREEVFG